MAYNNYFPATYQQQYYPQVQAPQPVAQPQDNTGINWVQGEAGARGFLTAPGRSVLLMDSESSVFYIKSTDMSGMPQPLRIFDYTERTAQQKPSQIVETQVSEIDTSNFVTKEELEERLSALTATRNTKGAAVK